MMRPLLTVSTAAVAAGVLVAAPALADGGSGSGVRPMAPAAAVGYAWPLAPPVRAVRGFDPPATPFGPGHLGVDLAARQGEPVLAAADGRVTFAGPVAGRGVVVLAHPDGVSTEYEPVAPEVAAGDDAARGATIGSVSGGHPGCPVASCLHWGARRGGNYIDPLDLLAPLGPVRLLPWEAPRD
jgi:murein DD-endopeptidase MepM/ murein hydrolase activator NlpD